MHICSFGDLGGRVDSIIEAGVMDNDTISEEELLELRNELEYATCFSNEEIESIIDMVKGFGSMEAATNYIKRLCE